MGLGYTPLRREFCTSNLRGHFIFEAVYRVPSLDSYCEPPSEPVGCSTLMIEYTVPARSCSRNPHGPQYRYDSMVFIQERLGIWRPRHTDTLNSLLPDSCGLVKMHMCAQNGKLPKVLKACWRASPEADLHKIYCTWYVQYYGRG